MSGMVNNRKIVVKLEAVNDRILQILYHIGSIIHSCCLQYYLDLIYYIQQEANVKKTNGHVVGLHDTITNAAVFEAKLHQFPDQIDVVRFGVLDDEYIYAAAYSSKNGSGYGGLLMPLIKLNELMRKYNGRIAFVNVAE
ncbi:MAG: hypothetical protein ACOZBH_04835 [Patescibacteria group bacterium]